jgi:hypothetical protein
MAIGQLLAALKKIAREFSMTARDHGGRSATSCPEYFFKSSEGVGPHPCSRPQQRLEQRNVFL